MSLMFFLLEVFIIVFIVNFVVEGFKDVLNIYVKFLYLYKYVYMCVL